mmetsp:Transcript_139454/g.446104  ORF Transcript_139454/g.446104 Transcript_139454/m.446104 type:complete len:349 (-) Transcript_139454:495-1541(-)
MHDGLGLLRMSSAGCAGLVEAGCHAAGARAAGRAALRRALGGPDLPSFGLLERACRASSGPALMARVAPWESRVPHRTSRLVPRRPAPRLRPLVYSAPLLGLRQLVPEVLASDAPGAPRGVRVAARRLARLEAWHGAGAPGARRDAARPVGGRGRGGLRIPARVEGVGFWVAGLVNARKRCELFLLSAAKSAPGNLAPKYIRRPVVLALASQTQLCPGAPRQVSRSGGPAPAPGRGQGHGGRTVAQTGGPPTCVAELRTHCKTAAGRLPHSSAAHGPFGCTCALAPGRRGAPPPRGRAPRQRGRGAAPALARAGRLALAAHAARLPHAAARHLGGVEAGLPRGGADEA